MTLISSRASLHSTNLLTFRKQYALIVTKKGYFDALASFWPQNFITLEYSSSFNQSCNCFDISVCALSNATDTIDRYGFFYSFSSSASAWAGAPATDSSSELDIRYKL
jgi:hypothetical protein